MIENIPLEEGYSFSVEPSNKPNQAIYTFSKDNQIVSQLTGSLPLQLSPQSTIAREIKKLLDPKKQFNKDKISRDFELVKQIADTHLAQLLEAQREEELLLEQEKENERQKILAESKELLQKLEHPLIWMGSCIEWETAGERKNILIAFLCFACQVILHEPISVIGLGEGGSGKTHILGLAQQCISKEHIEHQKSITEAAMFNLSKKDTYFYDGKIVDFGDLGGYNEQEFLGEAKNRIKELQSDGFLNRPTNVPTGDGTWAVEDMTLKGRPALTYTTVPGFHFDDQEKSRSIFITPRMDNKEAFDKRTFYLELKYSKTYSKYQLYHRKFLLIKGMVEHLKECLEDVEIINLYTYQVMDFLGDTPYYKRDYPKYSNIVKTITAINFYKHEIFELEDGKKVIYTNKEDMQLFISLFQDYQDSTNWSISPKAVEVFRDIQEKELELTETFNLTEGNVEYEELNEETGLVTLHTSSINKPRGFTVKEYHQLSSLGLSLRSLYNYFRELEEAQLLKVVNRDRTGNQYALLENFRESPAVSLDFSEDMKDVLLDELGEDVLRYINRDAGVDGISLMWTDESIEIPPWCK